MRIANPVLTPDASPGSIFNGHCRMLAEEIVAGLDEIAGPLNHEKYNWALQFVYSVILGLPQSWRHPDMPGCPAGVEIYATLSQPRAEE